MSVIGGRIPYTRTGGVEERLCVALLYNCGRGSGGAEDPGIFCPDAIRLGSPITRSALNMGYLGFGDGLWGRDARSWRRTLAIGRASAPLWTRRLVLQLPVWDEPATVG